MAIYKVALLLLFGMILLASDFEHAKACTKECDIRIEFGICPFLQTKIINGLCTNCCAGKKGCKYFSKDGTYICDGESEWVSEKNNNLEKACTKECDTRIDFGICPLLETKRVEGLCTNCCAGKKGCKYFSQDGTYICDGESEWVSEKDNNLEKACTKECDTRIDFGICPLLETKRVEGLCTNCCAGKKGCKYFSADGTYICDGESEWVSEGENDLDKSNVAIS
ncbi:hypothetical protein EJD97_019656 [Solanum chilense]|uniref:Proteinase inhibitor type-2 n=1 Tax=Solanum chilense TaxID=4083 RepID=A0A6N2AYM9_SOLCI|nr:hypothetical protein EJD97_019656 [Solanum chilense]